MSESSLEAAMETSTVRERLKKLKELQESKSKPYCVISMPQQLNHCAIIVHVSRIPLRMELPMSLTLPSTNNSVLYGCNVREYDY